MKINKKQLQQLKKLAIGLLIALGTMGSIYAVESFKNSSASLPADFVSAYQETSVYGNRMMSFARNVNNKVAEINAKDLEGGPAEPTLQLIEEARQDNARAREEAGNVVDGIASMAIEVRNIDHPDTKSKAVELLALESEIIKNFMDYNKKMDDFLQSLKRAVESDNVDDRLAVDSHLRVANTRIDMVNRLNEVFLRKADDLNLSTTD